MLCQRRRCWPTIKTTLVHCPANTRRWTSAGLMLAQRLRRWNTIKPALVPRVVFGVIQSFCMSGSLKVDYLFGDSRVACLDPAVARPVLKLAMSVTNSPRRGCQQGAISCLPVLSTPPSRSCRYSRVKATSQQTIGPTSTQYWCKVGSALPTAAQY